VAAIAFNSLNFGIPEAAGLTGGFFIKNLVFSSKLLQ